MFVSLPGLLWFNFKSDQYSQLGIQISFLQKVWWCIRFDSIWFALLWFHTGKKIWLNLVHVYFHSAPLKTISYDKWWDKQYICWCSATKSNNTKPQFVWIQLWLIRNAWYQIYTLITCCTPCDEWKELVKIDVSFIFTMTVKFMSKNVL